MKRVAVLFLGIVVLGLAPTVVAAQGYFPGLPSVGGFLGGPASCGASCDPGLPGPTFYVGWMWTDGPTGYGIGADTVGVGGVFQADGSYDTRGVWLGLSIPLRLTERLSVIGSGWYLIPGSSSGGTEKYNDSSTLARDWSAKTEWWFADGLLALSPGGGGFAFLAGARYDYYTAHLNNPTTTLFALGTGSDTADLAAYNVIPLVGAQYALNGARGNLLIRFVGIPTLVGSVRYAETLGAGGLRLENSGSWNKGNFWEIFGEASVKAFGSAAIGGFFRWNNAHGNANVDTDLNGGAVLLNDTFHLGFNRRSFTVGGSFQLDFAMPLF